MSELLPDHVFFKLDSISLWGRGQTDMKYRLSLLRAVESRAVKCSDIKSEVVTRGKPLTNSSAAPPEVLDTDNDLLSWEPLPLRLNVRVPSGGNGIGDGIRRLP